MGIADLITEHRSLAFDEHTEQCSVPLSTDRKVLDYNGEDEDGNLSPEAQLKQFVLGSSSGMVTAATGESGCKRIGGIAGAEGVPSVGNTVALKGLAEDPDIRGRFPERHFIQLGHDATDEDAVSELSRIVRFSGGK